MTKKYLLLYLLQFIFLTGYAQKKYSLGIEAVLYQSSTSDPQKKAGFSEAFGTQVTVRKNTVNHNYLSLAISTTVSGKYIYNFQGVRIGYETGNCFGVKNLFVIPEIAIKRFYLKKLSESELSVCPSLGFGYKIQLNKNLLLRSLINTEYHIPNNKATFFNNLSFGIHYMFD